MPIKSNNIAAKYITRETHQGSVNRVRHLLAEDIEALITQEIAKIHRRNNRKK
jgi:hypothetical protein